MTIVASYDWESDTYTHHTNGATNGHTPGASDFDADLDQLYSWMPVAAPAAAPLPEAAFSLTLRGKLDGIETLLTVRGMTSEEFRTNLASVRGLLDAPASPQGQPQGQLSAQQHNAAAMHRPVSGFCQIHNVQMHLNTGKDGRTWYSHRLAEGGFCKGK